MIRLLAIWAILLAFLVFEFAAARVPGLRQATPFVGIAMAVLVAFTFMRLAQGRGLIPIFALAGVFWVAIMLGLGSLDPFTRTDVPVAMRTRTIGPP